MGFLSFIKKIFKKPVATSSSKPKASPRPAILVPLSGEASAYVADWDKMPDGKAWTKMLSKALDLHGGHFMYVRSFKDEAKYFTKSWAQMTYFQRKQAMITLISAMAYQESKFNPKCDYEEDFEDAKGNPVISKGLLQLSKESVNQSAYGGQIRNPNELWDPATNLNLTVSIFDHWLSTDGYIGTYFSKGEKYGAARYWSCMRDISSSQAVIKSKTLALVFK